MKAMETSPPATPKPHQNSYNPKTKLKTLSFNYSPHHSIFVLGIALSLFLLFQIPSLIRTQFSSTTPCNSTNLDESMAVEKLRDGVTFLPLKDLRYARAALEGHTWFMSSMYDTHEEGEVQYQKFPSKGSKGRVLCVKGHDTHDGSWNYYALAWPHALPYNATLMKGLTSVSYNHYNYENIWHGLSAVFPFVGWHLKNGCKVPSRWVLYHWGELRTQMGLWLNLVLKATFGGEVNIEKFEGIEDDQPVCFEEAVVMRHNEGGMSRARRMEVYDHMRCKARVFCNVSSTSVHGNDPSVIGMTLLLRTGARSFKNESSVIEIFKSECHKVQGCRLKVAYANNLTFCQQVELMSLTDVLVSPHGAQLTNMFLMERNSSVMEFFPKGWLKLAGVGQYVYHWIASWSGMKHEGAYRDSNGNVQCPYPDDDRRCMSIFKGAQIGHDEPHFREWASRVLNEVKIRKLEEASNMNRNPSSNECSCHL